MMLVMLMMLVMFRLVVLRLLVLVMLRGLGWLVVMCLPLVVDGARAIRGIVVMGDSGVPGHTAREHDAKSHNQSDCP